MAYGTGKKAAFVTLRGAGKSLSACAAELKISKATAVSWGRELAKEVAAAYKAHFDEVATTYQMQKTQRIAAIGRRLMAIDAELEARPLDEVPTAGLLLMRAQIGRLALAEMADLEKAESAAMAAAAAEETKPKHKSLAEIFKEIDEEKARKAALEAAKAAQAGELPERVPKVPADPPTGPQAAGTGLAALLQTADAQAAAEGPHGPADGPTAAEGPHGPADGPTAAEGPAGPQGAAEDGPRGADAFAALWGAAND